MLDRLQYTMRAMQVLERSQEVTSQNLANINTSGYKSSGLFFTKLQDARNKPGEILPQQHIRRGQGPLEQTGNRFDFAIEGNGFFQVEKNGEMMLSRGGQFKVNSNGILVDSKGAKVQGVGGAIHLPLNVQRGAEQRSAIDVNVTNDGTLRINGKTYDKLQLVSVPQSAELQRAGEGYLRYTGSEPLQPDIESTVQQGYVESSNVNTLKEMVNMTKTARLFEAQQRAMRTQNDLLSQVSGKLGKY